MKTYFCTYFDHRYISRGLALYESLVRNCADAHLFILCLSDKCHSILRELNLANASLINMADFERGDSDLAEAKANRSVVEYYFTCTPSLLLYIFKSNSEVGSITYLDSDLYFFSDLKPLFSEIANSSIAIIGHRFPPHLKHLEVYGKFNVSWMTFRKDENGLACLNWYRDKCNEWCYDRLDHGRFADQGYLDYFHEKFEGVTEIKHKGANLAPWNIYNVSITYDCGVVKVDTQDLIFYHFHEFMHIFGPFYLAWRTKYYSRIPKLVRVHIYREYIRCLRLKQRLTRCGRSRDTKIRTARTEWRRVQDGMPLPIAIATKSRYLAIGLMLGTCIIYTPKILTRDLDKLR